MLCFFIHLASRNEHAGTAGSYTAYGGTPHLPWPVVWPSCT
jgi:hypothetical protein